MKAAYYYKKDTWVRVFLNFDEWNVRNLHAKGIKTAHHVLTRQMTKREIDSIAGARQLIFFTYTSWAHLLDDERRMDVPEDVVQRLKVFAKLNNLEAL